MRQIALTEGDGGFRNVQNYVMQRRLESKQVLLNYHARSCAPKNLMSTLSSELTRIALPGLGTIQLIFLFNYSGDPITGHSKTGIIQKPDVLKVGLTIRKPDKMVRFSNVMWKPDIFVRFSNGFAFENRTNGPVFKCHSITGPFTIPPYFKHSKTGHVLLKFIWSFFFQ